MKKQCIRGADKSLARPTSRCILFDGENISFDASLVIYINSYVMFWLGNLRERNHWGDPDVDGRIILRWIFRKREGVVGTGWSWLRVGTGGGLLWVQ